MESTESWSGQYLTNLSVCYCPGTDSVAASMHVVLYWHIII